MIVDIHTHYQFPEFIRDPRAYLDKEPFAAYLASNPGHRDVTVNEMIAAADEDGIQWLGLQGFMYVQHETCVALNDYGLESLQRYPDRLLPFACLQPKAGKDAVREFTRCIDGGMVGAGELNPVGQKFSLDDSDFIAIVRAAIDMGVPLMLHFNETVGHDYPGKSLVPLRDLYQFILKYPELVLIIAHWGGGLPYYELMPEVKKACRNVYYDTAASPLLYSSSIFPITADIVGAEKILFGTDYPLICFRKQQTEPGFGKFLCHVRESGLDPISLQSIFGDNAARLFDLEDSDQEGSGRGGGKVRDIH
ncbi:MAG: amidohydrolase [Anaerolineales bacterium]|nr:amidohydrolase [Anaerolineales bacterium]